MHPTIGGPETQAYEAERAGHIQIARILLAGARLTVTVFCPNCKAGEHVVPETWHACECGTQHLVTL